MAVIIIRPLITRLLITTIMATGRPTMNTGRCTRGLLYARAFATTTLTGRATTAAQFTATGIDLRHALDDASVPFACGDCADAPKRVIKLIQISGAP